MLEKYYISKKDNTDLNVYRCGIEECSPGHSWGPGVRDHYIIHVILSGKGYFSVNESTHALHAGQGFLICPGQIVFYQADKEMPWTYSWVGFHGLKAEAILEKSGIGSKIPVFDFGESDNLPESLNDMITAARSDTPSDLMLTGLLFQFLARLVESQRNKFQERSNSAGSDRYVARAVEYIEKNYSLPLSVRELAEYLKIDRSYLSALFTRYLGISPRDFIIRYRMNKACDLLRNPQLNVGDAARSVGYEDPLQFSKTFRKTIGKSPSAFREGI